MALTICTHPFRSCDLATIFPLIRVTIPSPGASSDDEGIVARTRSPMKCEVTLVLFLTRSPVSIDAIQVESNVLAKRFVPPAMASLRIMAATMLFVMPHLLKPDATKRRLLPGPSRPISGRPSVVA